MIRFLTLILILMTLDIGQARAEYRVYQLAISTEGSPEVMLLSTLDDQQYQGYFTLPPNQRIRYVTSWMCWGDTSLTPFCPNPKVQTGNGPQPASAGPTNPL